ncbi:MAG: prolyl oligopeptidase family serine peptidase [Armatimonadota bacterium]
MGREVGWSSAIRDMFRSHKTRVGVAIVAVMLAAACPTCARSSRYRPATREAFDERAQRLIRQIDLARSRANDWQMRALDSLEVEVRWWQWRLAQGGRSAPKQRDFDAAYSAADRMRADVSGVRRWIDPFKGRTGVILKGYRSEIDGNLQPYSLNIPPDYTGEEPVPLVLTMHGHGGSRPFQGHPAGRIPGCIVVSPHGRGSVDYMYTGEVDVMRVLEEVRRDYNIDSDRIYATGGSMGGTGSWTLAVHYPDVFAAIAPIAGNADHHAWEEVWKWGRRPTPCFDDLRTFVRDNINPRTYAENLLNVPVFVVHGDKDNIVPVQHARKMTAALRQLWSPVIYRECWGVGHGGFPGWLMSEQRDWLLSQRRDRWPREVRFKTAFLRHSGAYWVHIDRFEQPFDYGTVHAEVLGGDRVCVTTSNVSALRLDVARPLVPEAERITVEIDGQQVYEGRPPIASEMAFHKSAGDWADGAPAEPGLVKRAGLEGPVEDAFLSPFLVVYGTTARDALTRRVIRDEAEEIVRRWKAWYVDPCRIRADVSVEQEDVEQFNLILVGDQDANALTKEIAGELPIRVEPGRVFVGDETFVGKHVGAEFCYPNPLNPQRYVVLMVAPSWQGMYQIAGRFGNWFDWGVYDNRRWFDYAVFDDRTWGPESFLAVGFFGQHWDLEGGRQWRGMSESRAVAVRKVPANVRPSIWEDKVYLSDLLPVAYEQNKGQLTFDQSATSPDTF